jgi:hypothetical protein
MAQLKKTIARLILHGICVLGILIGFSLVYLTITVFFPALRDNIAFPFFELLVLGFMLALCVFLIRDSYLMLRGKTFGAIKTVSVLIALMFFSSVVDPIHRFAVKFMSGIQARTVVEFASFSTCLLLSVIVYLICIKLLKRLLKVAYGPEKISEIQNSMDKQ